MRFGWMLAGAVGLSVLAMAAHAQTSFEEFLKLDEAAQRKDSATDQEVAQFEEVLNSADTDRVLRAMTFMLASGKPHLVRRAKEFGLLSAEGLIRHEALKKVLDEGGPFRIEVDLTKVDEEKSNMRAYINRLNGGYSTDGGTGFYVFRVDPYDQDAGCWKFKGNGNCAAYLSNDSISLKDWDRGAGSLTLENNGIMRGTLRYTYSTTNAPVPAQIVLVK